MNVRLASLDPKAPRAEKGYRVCKRRRIQCDRILPTCKKCEVRKLDCSGYGLSLKWGNGVASRGRLAGRTLPVVEATSLVNTVLPAPRGSVAVDLTDIKNTTGALRSDTPDSLKMLLEEHPLAKSGQHQDVATDQDEIYDLFNDDAPDAILATKAGKAHSQADQKRIATSLTFSLSTSPGILQDPSARQLLQYYDHSVASTMVWVDSPDNPWRTIIMPLAIETPCLLFSILGFAAEHLSARIPPIGQESFFMSKDFQNKSLKLLSQELFTEAHTGISNTSLSRRNSAHSILATMLILSNIEMVKSSSTLWRLHLQAAHTMIQRWLPDLSDTTSIFLISDCSVFLAFAATTNFDETDELPSYVLTAGSGAIFVEYVEVLQDVTVAEKHRHAAYRAGLPCAPADVQNLQTRFEFARARELWLCQQSTFSNSLLRGDFENVVESYHHAGLIYCYQMLLSPPAAKLYISHSLEMLLANLRPIVNSHVLARDLVWPLFIAGTESRGKKEGQEWVEEKLTNAIQNSGYSLCQPALTFLRIFWVADQESLCTWVNFARDHASNLPPFAAF